MIGMSVDEPLNDLGMLNKYKLYNIYAFNGDCSIIDAIKKCFSVFFLFMLKQYIFYYNYYQRNILYVEYVGNYLKYKHSFSIPYLKKSLTLSF
jgi:hypothetical protein